MTQWTFEPILGSYLAVSLLTLGMVALLAVRPTFRRLEARQRWVLLAIRDS